MVKLAPDFQKKTLSYLKGLSDRTAERVAKTVARRAKENFSNANYDGPQSHLDAIRVETIKRENGSWVVKASGYAVSFIEFGTGKVGDGTYKGKVPASYSYDANLSGVPSHIPGNSGWYFTSEQDLASNLEHAYRYIRGRDEYGDMIEMPERLYKGRAKSGKVGFVKESMVGLFKARGGEVIAVEPDEQYEKRRKRQALESGALVKAETENSYYTHGNEANNCLQEATEYALEHINEIAKKAVKK